MSIVRDVLDKLSQIPFKVWLRLSILVAMLVGGAALILWTPLGDYFTEEAMIALLEDVRSLWWTPLALIAAYAIITPLGFIPVSPLLVAGGFVFGPFWGSVYNVTGLLVGAMVGFWVARLLGRDFVVQLAGKRLRRAEMLFEKQGFWPLVQTRFLPIPFAFISYGAALAGVGTGRFLITSAIGVMPATITHTYFAPRLLKDPDPLIGLLYLGILVMFNVVVGWPSIRERLRRRRRLEELRSSRYLRDGGSENGAAENGAPEKMSHLDV